MDCYEAEGSLNYLQSHASSKTIELLVQSNIKNDFRGSWAGWLEYCKYNYPTESDLQIQCNPHENYNYTLDRTYNSNKTKIHMKA